MTTDNYDLLDQERIRSLELIRRLHALNKEYERLQDMYDALLVDHAELQSTLEQK